MSSDRRLVLASAAAAAAALASLGLAAATNAGESSAASLPQFDDARHGSVSVSLSAAARNIPITAAAAPDRPLVLIDPGHGGRDPGARTALLKESAVTLALARELRDALASRGRVRVALTRDEDRWLSLAQRAAIARALAADLFLSIHADSAANPNARGATVYSLAEVASDAESARFAAGQGDPKTSAAGPFGASVRSLLADLAMRDEMRASAELAARMVDRAATRWTLRPAPHRFAAFAVLRHAATTAVLVEAGYLSNAVDAARLATPQSRAPLVEALAAAIEADLAVRRTDGEGASH